VSVSRDPSVRSRKSAGILLYRRRDGVLEIFLVHPGGPLWARKDDGAWSVPKGEYTEDEAPLLAAQREFAEETGATVQGPFAALTPVKQPSGKLITAWAAAGDLDPSQLRSNHFSIVGTRYAGTYPEVDRGAWFTPDEARRKLVRGQVPFVDELERLLARGVIVAP
jgi:predicted NUDIX family NTP pyrophosphohydrolase